MKLFYKNKKLEISLTIDKEIIKTYGARAKKIKQRINELESWDNLYDISRLPALRLHPLKGNKKGEWAVDIQKNWRICFEISRNPLPLLENGGIDLSKVKEIKIISIEDYH